MGKYLNEIKLNLKDISDIFNKAYEDSMLEYIDKKYKENSKNNYNLKCTNQDVDNIIKSLEKGEVVKISMDGDIKVDKQEGNQFYNKDYPYFTQYTIS